MDRDTPGRGCSWPHPPPITGAPCLPAVDRCPMPGAAGRRAQPSTLPSPWHLARTRIGGRAATAVWRSFGRVAHWGVDVGLCTLEGRWLQVPSGEAEDRGGLWRGRLSRSCRPASSSRPHLICCCVWITIVACLPKPRRRQDKAVTLLLPGADGRGAALTGSSAGREGRVVAVTNGGALAGPGPSVMTRGRRSTNASPAGSGTGLGRGRSSTSRRRGGVDGVAGPIGVAWVGHWTPP
ncbi:hypothetical protein ACVW19_006746 [Streptomyces sp. TE5632]